MSFGPAFQTICRFHKLLTIAAPWLALAAYWLFIFTLTHLPGHKLPQVKVIGADKTMHYLAYLGLGITFCLAYYRNVRPSLRQKRTWLVLVALVGYGIFDELTQHFVGRSTDPADFMFNCMGLISAMIIVFLVHRLVHWIFLAGAVLFVLSHWPTPTHLIELPDELAPLKIIGYMGGYCLLTVMWWRALSPGNKFMVNRYIFCWTTAIMTAYAIIDHSLLTLMKREFNSEWLTTALLSIVVGLIVSFLLGLQNQAEENYQKYLKHLEERDPNDFETIKRDFGY